VTRDGQAGLDLLDELHGLTECGERPELGHGHDAHVLVRVGVCVTGMVELAAELESDVAHPGNVGRDGRMPFAVHLDTDTAQHEGVTMPDDVHVGSGTGEQRTDRLVRVDRQMGTGRDTRDDGARFEVVPVLV
jgi:hypothetical protein